MFARLPSVAIPFRTPLAGIKPARRAAPARLVHSSPARTMPAVLAPWAAHRYPPARRSDHVDVYKSEKHGEVRVHDPYQWLEQNTAETEQWTTAQEKFTREHLDSNPDRKELEDEIRKNLDYAKVWRARARMTRYIVLRLS